MNKQLDPDFLSGKAVFIHENNKEHIIEVRDALKAADKKFAGYMLDSQIYEYLDRNCWCAIGAVASSSGFMSKFIFIRATGKQLSYDQIFIPQELIW